MTDYREINQIARDPARARAIARHLLTIGAMAWTDWELDFLDSMSAQEEPLSTRQGEKIVELRDEAVLHARVEGFRLDTLIDRCWLGRDELDEPDRGFIERLKAAGATSLRKREAMRLLRCARRLGEIEPHQGWTFVAPGLQRG